MADNAWREHRTGLVKILEQPCRAQTRLDEHGKNLGMLAEADRQQDDQSFEDTEQGGGGGNQTKTRYQD